MKGQLHMPTYEYACKSCGEHLEVVQSFKDNALTECPACGGTLRKVFGNIGITFKGSGFYKTDSRSDGHKGASRPAETKMAEGGADGAGKASGSPDGPKPEAASKDGGAKDGGAKDGGAKDGGAKERAGKTSAPASSSAAAAS
jgi:putative FmdB family regulatory protein